MTVLHCIVWCAVAAGKVTMATIDRALGRALTAKMSVPSHPVCNSHHLCSCRHASNSESGTPWSTKHCDGRRRLGLFDPPSIQPYTKYGLKDLSAPAYLAALADAAAQSFVRTLSNETLPSPSRFQWA